MKNRWKTLLHDGRSRAAAVFVIGLALWALASAGRSFAAPQVRPVSDEAVLSSRDAPGEEPLVTPIPMEEAEREQEEAPPIMVYVCGAVRNAGVYALPEGSRVIAAVNAAGGYREDAQPEAVNQAAILRDADMVRIPTLAELDSGAVAAASPTVGAGAAQAESPLDLNTATKEDLMRLSGIGEAKAENILAYRAANGRFSSVEELTQVSGIGPASLAKWKDKLTVR